MGYFQVELQEKKNAYIKKNVQKNRKIVKNLLMYDKKNFLPHIQKKSPKKQNRPNKVKKRKRMKKIQNNQRNSEVSLF
jgi:DNA polymerase IIIc chi subunit